MSINKILLIIGFSIVGGIFFIIILSLVVGWLVATPDYNSESPSYMENIKEYKLLDNVEFASIMKDYHFNEIVAKNKYIGKKYRITGEINDIIDGWNEIEFYSPKDDGIEAYYFNCNFSTDKELLKVKVGDIVTVLGVLDYIGGFESDFDFLNNKLKNCHISEFGAKEKVEDQK